MSSMANRSPFHIFEPYCFSGLLDDPILAIRSKPNSQFLLIDCGKIDQIAKRVLKAVSSVFITHAHMDHFMGFDTFARSVLVSARTIDIYGPPSIATRLESKLNGYDWNLVEDYYCNFRVHEIHSKHCEVYLLKGSEGFKKLELDRYSFTNKVILDNHHFKVEAVLCEHFIPVLAFKFTEKPRFAVDESKIAQLGYVKGRWLKDLKFQFNNPEKSRVTEIELSRHDKSGKMLVEKHDPTLLYKRIQRNMPLVSIGYMTDLGYSEKNVKKICPLMKDVTLLVSECTYLKNEMDKARQTHHLCTHDVNRLLELVKPSHYLPMHLSNKYLHRHELLYEELEGPKNCTILQLPDRLTPAPMLPTQCPELFPNNSGNHHSVKN
jgi:ribonuclease Z